MAFSSNITIVLDINGVLADVKKKCAPAPQEVPVDLVIPSGQKVYMRPHLDEFFNFLNNMRIAHPKLRVAMWTSRKFINAKPIEVKIRKDCDFMADIYLHGEDCQEYQGFHPIKDVQILRSKLKLAANERVLFIDDSPERIKLDSFSKVIGIKTFSAGEYNDNELIYKVCMLYKLIKMN